MGTANCQGNLTKCLGRGGGGGRVTCDGLASHRRGSSNTPSVSCLGNRNKLQRCGPLGSWTRYAAKCVPLLERTPWKRKVIEFQLQLKKPICWFKVPFQERSKER